MARLEWFDHFYEFFNNCHTGDSTGFVQDFQDHSTSIFYAFDLPRGINEDITAKAYFFPKMRARKRGQTHLEVLTEAIYSAPGLDRTNLKAFAKFRDFCHDELTGKLELDMLAIDLEDPSEGRVKIYFRSRQTSFNSVASTIYLGGRVYTPAIAKGIESLRQLWHDVLNVDTDGSLRHTSDHRTAGVLYNVELRKHCADPVVKVYIPVRHYARSDEAVMRGLAKHYAGSTTAVRFREAMNTL
jgi:DMATS type aromatic prenyltransferase